MSAKPVPTLADRGRRVVSTRDTHGRVHYIYVKNLIIITSCTHALLWFIPGKWNRKKREEAHVSNMLNFTVLVCADIDCLVCPP
jgi:hypothetical protein